MVVEVGPEIEQLVFEIASRPEQQVIQNTRVEGNGQIAHRKNSSRMGILRNHGRNNNSPGTAW